jgi:hypothetical protein
MMRGASRSRVIETALLVLVMAALCGCFCRRKGAGSREMTNLWNRNAIVAVPTFTGNLVGTALSLPPVYLTTKILVLANCWQKGDTEPFERLLAFTRVMALGGGALFGTPFIPFSFLLPEDPEYCWAD